MDRKDDLCGKALEYFLEHGIAELSLRPLAHAIGTSARLLIYHFGSKDGLITAVMDEARRRAQHSFTDLMRDTREKSPLKKFWMWATHSRNSRYVRLLFEVQMLALQNPAAYARYLEGTSSSWLALIEGALPPSADRRATATLCAAVIDGLMLEFLSTGDLRRTSAAIDIFGSLLKGRSQQGKSTSRGSTQRRR
jgi:AcrR family transcriptional regulator